ncbi:hypothetical protein PGB90_010614 [Kerria lacca]
MSDNDLKRKILKLFDEMSEVDQKIFLEIISKRLTETLPQSFDINEVTKVVEILFYFLDNSVVGVRVIQENFLIIINIYIECFTVFLQHLSFTLPKSWIQLLKNSKKIDPCKCLALCYGFFVNIPMEILSKSFEEIDHAHSLLVTVLDSLFFIYNRYPNDSSLLSGILKILLLFTQRVYFTKHDVPLPLLKTLVLFLWTQLDHFLNVVKNLAKECLNNVLFQKDINVNDEIQNLIRSHHEIDRKLCTLLCCISTAMTVHFVLSCYERLIEDLIIAGKYSRSSYIAQTYISLMISSYEENSFENWFELWIQPLFTIGDEFHYFTEPIFKAVMKLCPHIQEKLQYLANETNYQLFIKYFLMSGHHNFVHDEKKKIFGISTVYLFRNYNIFIPLFETILRNPNSETANTIASLIVEDFKLSSNINDKQLELFKIYINNNLNNPDIGQQQIFFLLIKKIFLVIRNISYHKEKNQNYSLHSDFLKWTVQRCFSGLFIGASFSRRHIALRILEILSDLNLWILKNYSAAEIHNILFFLTDSYEENQQLAIRLVLPVALRSNYFDSNDLKSLYCTIIDMILNVNFCEHSTAARLLQFLCSHQNSSVIQYLFSVFLKYIVEHYEEFLKINDLEKVENNNSYYIIVFILFNLLLIRLEFIDEDKLANKPFYGLLYVIRHLLERMEMKNFILNEDWKQLISKIAITCIDCNSRVMTVVGHSSPEGYLPEEVNEISDDLTYCTSSQRILVCSWRTVKEASLLLSFIIKKFTIAESTEQEPFIEKSLFLNIGTHLKTLLFEIKHKGAFEQVYIAMYQFCHCCWRYSDNTINILPKQWLMETVNRILTNSSDLCTSRRSAGIPYVAIAILSTECGIIRKCKSNPLFDLFMRRIMDISNSITSVIDSKVHAMNVLRMIFKNKEFTEIIDIYIERSIMLAIIGIRNVSWLLLGSIINRIFGIQTKSRINGKIFFHNYPLLFEFFMSYLCENSRSEINRQSPLYAVLLIFAKFGPFSKYDGCGNNFQLKSFIPLICECSRSQTWKIRQTAAFALIPLITPDIFVNYIYILWQQILLSTSENAVHGLLFQLDVLLKNISVCIASMKNELRIIFTKILTESLLILSNDRHSYVVKQQLLATMIYIIKIDLLQLHSVSCKLLSDVISYKLFNFNHSIIKAPIQIAENEYLKYKLTFHICLLYYLDANMDKVTSAESNINLRRFIENEILCKPRFENPSNKCTIFDFFYIVLSVKAGEINTDSLSILQDEMIRDIVNGHVNKAILLGEYILNSREIFVYVSESITQNFHCDSTELIFALRILSYFVKSSSFECIGMNLITELCNKYYRNSMVLTSLVKYLDASFTYMSYYNSKERVSIMRELYIVSSSSTSNSFHYEMVLFYFKFRHTILLCDNDILILDIYTFILEHAVTFQIELQHVLTDIVSNHFDEFSILNTFINEFYEYLQAKPQVCAVALISWILGHIGKEEDVGKMNTIFSENVSECFEDYLILSRLSSVSLRSLIMSNPNLLEQVLDKNYLEWIVIHCNLEKEENIISLNDFIQLISKKYNAIASSTSNTFSFLRANNCKKQFALSKMTLLISNV